VTGSLDDPAAVARATEGATHVLHLGAFMSWAAEDRDAMFRANVEGPACSSTRPPRRGSPLRLRLLGRGLSRDSPESLPVTEDHPLRPTSPYGLTKLLGEELVRFHAGRAGWRR
jgi:UDP-glucose 4-epimerase